MPPIISNTQKIPCIGSLLKNWPNCLYIGPNCLQIRPTNSLLILAPDLPIPLGKNGTIFSIVWVNFWNIHVNNYHHYHSSLSYPNASLDRPLGEAEAPTIPRIWHMKVVRLSDHSSLSLDIVIAHLTSNMQETSVDNTESAEKTIISNTVLFHCKYIIKWMKMGKKFWNPMYAESLSAARTP